MKINLAQEVILISIDIIIITTQSIVEEALAIAVVKMIIEDTD